MSFLQRFQQSADNVANEYAQRQADIDGVNARGLAKFNETQNYLTQTQNAKNSQILMGADLEKLGGGIGVEPVAAKAITYAGKAYYARGAASRAAKAGAEGYEGAEDSLAEGFADAADTLEPIAGAVGKVVNAPSELVKLAGKGINRVRQAVQNRFQGKGEPESGEPEPTESGAENTGASEASGPNPGSSEAVADTGDIQLDAPVDFAKTSSFGAPGGDAPAPPQAPAEATVSEAKAPVEDSTDAVNEALPELNEANAAEFQTKAVAQAPSNITATRKQPQ